MSFSSFKQKKIAPRSQEVPIIDSGLTKPIQSAKSPDILNWDSDLANERMQMYQNDIAKQNELLNKIFENSEKNLYAPNGSKIENLTTDNDWFRQNVAFIFSIGKIFNRSDREQLDTIIAYFQNTDNRAFLMNTYELLNYKDQKIKQIEQSINITNGNYHIMLIPIVIAENTSNAPEKKYSSIGVVDRFFDWSDVNKYMIEIVKRYGLIATQHDTISSPSYTIGIEGQTIQTQREWKDNEEFNINGLIGDDMTEMEQTLSFRAAQDDILKGRYRNTHKDRAGLNTDSGPGRGGKASSLYARMNEYEEIGPAGDMQPSYTKGVQLRFNERKQPQSIKQPEFQIYEENDTYIDGENVPQNDIATRFADIPRTPQVEGTKSRGRTVTTNIKQTLNSEQNTPIRRRSHK